MRAPLSTRHYSQVSQRLCYIQRSSSPPASAVFVGTDAPHWRAHWNVTELQTPATTTTCALIVSNYGPTQRRNIQNDSHAVPGPFNRTPHSNSPAFGVGNGVLP